MINRPDMTPFKKRLLGRGYLSKVSFPGDRVEAGVTTVIASKSMVCRRCRRVHWSCTPPTQPYANARRRCMLWLHMLFEVSLRSYKGKA